MPAKTWNQLVADAPEQATSFEPLPDGSYDFKIAEASVTHNSAQKVGYNITAVVESGPYANRKIWNTFWVSPESPTAMGIFFRQFAALGLDRAYFQAEPNDEQIAAALVNRRFNGVVNTREWEGTKKNNLKNVQAARGPAPVVAGPGVPSAAAPVVASGVPSGVPTPVAAPAVPVVNVPAPPAPAAPAAAVPAQDPWANATPAVPSTPAAPVAPPLPPLGGPGGSPF